jgi:hypothetical protein
MSQACITGDVTGVRRRDVSQGNVTRWCHRDVWGITGVCLRECVTGMRHRLCHRWRSQGYVTEVSEVVHTPCGMFF